MKKILLFLFTLLIAPCMFVLCSCGGNGKIANVFISVINDQITFDKDNKVICVEYEELANFELKQEDFKIEIEYENSKKEVLQSKDFEIELSCEVAGMQPDSHYDIDFVFNGKEESFATLDLYVCAAVVPLIKYEEDMAFTYCDKEINILEQLDLLQEGGKTISSLIEEGVVTVGATSTTKATVYNIHGYKLTLKLAKGYVWSNGSDEDIVISWQINRKRMTIPALETTKVYDYDIVNGEIVGKEQVFEADFGENQNKIEYSGITRATDASVYGKYCWISTKSFFQDKYVLYDEKTDTEYPAGYQVRWEIIQKEIAAPTLKNYDFTFAKPYVDVLGVGKENLQNFDETFMQIDTANSATKAYGTGEGKVRISIKENLANNFKFADSDNESVDIRDDYIDNNYFIEKGVFAPQSEIDNEKLQINSVYQRNLTPSKLTLVKTLSAMVVDWTEEAWAYLKEQGFVNDNTGEAFSFRWKGDFTQNLNAGFYENKVLEYLHYGDCYEPYELVVDITIDKSVLDFDAQDAMEIGFENHIYTYSTTAAPIELKQNFINRLNIFDENFGTVYYILEYRKNAADQPTTYKLTTEQFKLTDISEYMIDAGFYSLGVELVADDNYLVSINQEEASEEDSVFYGFRIEKHKADLKLVSIENNLQAAGFYEENMLDFYFKDSQAVSLVLKSWEEKEESSKRLLRLLKLQQNYASASSLAASCSKVTTYYRATTEEDWSISQTATNIGYYKNVYEFTSISDNVEINNLEVEWQIHSNILNFESVELTWADYKNQTYSATAKEGAKLSAIPECIIKTKYENYLYTGTISENPVEAIDADSYATKFSFMVPNDGSVTVTYPSGMFYESEGENCKIYTFKTAKFWNLWAFYLSPNDFKFSLVKDTFEYDGQDKQVEFKFESYLNSALTEKLLEFFGDLTLTGKTNEKVATTYQAKIVLPYADLDSNFNYYFDNFDDNENYIYDSATDTITVILTWQIVVK